MLSDILHVSLSVDHKITLLKDQRENFSHTLLSHCTDLSKNAICSTKENMVGNHRIILDYAKRF